MFYFLLLFHHHFTEFPIYSLWFSFLKWFLHFFLLKLFLIYRLEHPKYIYVEVPWNQFCLEWIQILIVNLVGFFQMSKSVCLLEFSPIFRFLFPLSLPPVFNPIPSHVVLHLPPPKSWSPSREWGLIMAC